MGEIPVKSPEIGKNTGERQRKSAEAPVAAAAAAAAASHSSQ